MPGPFGKIIDDIDRELKTAEANVRRPVEDAHEDVLDAVDRKITFDPDTTFDHYKDMAEDSVEHYSKYLSDTAEHHGETLDKVGRKITDEFVKETTPYYEDPGDLMTFGEDYEGTPVIYVNGMLTSRADAEAAAERLAEELKRPVELMYNPRVAEQAGPEGEFQKMVDELTEPLDPLAKVGIDVGGATEATINTAQHISKRLDMDGHAYDRLTKRLMTRIEERANAGDTDIVVVAHSDGNTHVNGAVHHHMELGNDDTLEHVSWYAVGSPLFSFEPKTSAIKLYEEVKFSSDPAVTAAGFKGSLPEWGTLNPGEHAMGSYLDDPETPGIIAATYFKNKEDYHSIITTAEPAPLPGSEATDVEGIYCFGAMPPSTTPAPVADPAENFIDEPEGFSCFGDFTGYKIDDETAFGLDSKPDLKVPDMSPDVFTASPGEVESTAKILDMLKEDFDEASEAVETTLTEMAPPPAAADAGAEASCCVLDSGPEIPEAVTSDGLDAITEPIKDMVSWFGDTVGDAVADVGDEVADHAKDVLDAFGLS